MHNTAGSMHSYASHMSGKFTFDMQLLPSTLLMQAVPSCSDEAHEDRVPEGMSPKVVEVYKAVAKIMSRYSAGKVPKAFKIIPNLSNWEEVSTLLA